MRGKDVQMTLNVFFIPVRFSGCVQRGCPSVCARVFQQPNLLLASLLFGPLLPSKPLSQGPLLLSKVVKHENETLIYLTFSAVQMSHWVLMRHALHVFLIGTFWGTLGLHLWGEYSRGDQGWTVGFQYTCANVLTCAHTYWDKKSIHLSIHFTCLVRSHRDKNYAIFYT